MAKVRDVVVALRSDVTNQPRVLGMVAEVFGRRRIFVPMTRVTHIDSGQVYTTGLLNMRRFEQRSTETLVIGQMFDRRVVIRSGVGAGLQGTVYDVAMEQARNRDWAISRVAVQSRRRGSADEDRPTSSSGAMWRGSPGARRRRVRPISTRP